MGKNKDFAPARMSLINISDWSRGVGVPGGCGAETSLTPLTLGARGWLRDKRQEKRKTAFYFAKPL